MVFKKAPPPDNLPGYEILGAEGVECRLLDLSDEIWEAADTLRDLMSDFGEQMTTFLVKTRRKSLSAFSSLVCTQGGPEAVRVQRMCRFGIFCGPYRGEPRTVLLGTTRTLLDCWPEIEEFIETCSWKPEKRVRQRGQNLIEFSSKRKKERESRDQAI
jgi:hypothetical protein